MYAHACAPRVESIRDVDLLSNRDYQDLLKYYWRLIGGGATDTGDAIVRAIRGEAPAVRDLSDSAVVAAYAQVLPEVRAAVSQDVLRRAAGLLAVTLTRGQASETA